MRILVFSQTFYPVIGGMESNTETLMQALIELGHQTTLITESALNGKPELNTSYPIVRNKSLMQFQKYLAGVDLLIINGDISVPACFMGYINRVPYIVIYQMAGKIMPRKNGVFHLLLHRFRLFLGSRAIYHLGVSKACIRSKNVIKKREGVLYNSISKELLFYAANPKIINRFKKYDILFAGRVINGKGVNVLSDALAILDKEQLAFNALFSGEGVDKEEVKAKVATFKNIKTDFQPFAKGESLASTFASSRVMVLASTTHQEGSPLSIVEAFAFGLPVIVSDQPVMLELIDIDAGLFHHAGDAKELSNKIKQALNEDTYKQLSLSAKEKSKRFTYDKYVSHLSKILSEIEDCKN